MGVGSRLLMLVGDSTFEVAGRCESYILAKNKNALTICASFGYIDTQILRRTQSRIFYREADTIILHFA